jgi:hypothetical protein
MKLTPFLLSIALFSCSSSTEDKNSKMTELINKEKVLQLQIDSFKIERSKSSFIDTFILDDVTPEIELKRKEEVERVLKVDTKIEKSRAELGSIKFSIDSLSKMK